LKVIRVYPLGLARTGGLREDDVIQSINGYDTQSLGHLSWVVANATSPERTLKMNVRGEQGQDARGVTLHLP
jgi:hypothetical protein